MDYKQTCVDLMGDHLANLMDFYCEEGDMETAHAIYSEWMVDDTDPEGGEYQFLFINDLTAI